MKVLYYFYTKGDLFMEFRVLQYFLAVTREQSISGAAEALHLSQPTLSRQLKDMEEELGKQLFNPQQSKNHPDGRGDDSPQACGRNHRAC